LVMSGALQLHSSSVARRAGSGIDDGFAQGHHGHGGYGHGQDGGYGSGGGVLSLEEELRQIDIGTGRSSRRYNAGHGHGHGQGYGSQGFVYGQQGGY
jgi:hypothetical protein